LVFVGNVVMMGLSTAGSVHCMLLVEAKGRRDSRTVRGKLLLLSSLRPLQLIRSESQYSHDSKVTWAAVVSTTCSLSV